jgi:hypothetical protein
MRRHASSHLSTYVLRSVFGPFILTLMVLFLVIPLFDYWHKKAGFKNGIRMWWRVYVQGMSCSEVPGSEKYAGLG